MADLIEVDPWQRLRSFTPARIALGRAGASLPTEEVLKFSLAHAQAQDAVHLPLDVERVCHDIDLQAHRVLHVVSAAGDRTTYLQRPDLGRRLDEAGRILLQSAAPDGGCDANFVVADGLSALAIHRHAVSMVADITALLDPERWRIGPVVVATQARVALGDQIGALLNSRCVVVLIGERPGLSSPDSLGIYLTFDPRVGRTDAERNCISNVHPEGLDYARAARKLHFLMEQSRRLKVSGVGLKDSSDALETQ
jgi:ethanolamine ammonia-lyase small subunit